MNLIILAIIGVILATLGIASGLLTAWIASNLAKGGAAFIGAVSSSAIGLMIIVNTTDLQINGGGHSVAIGLGQMMTGVVAAVIGSAFLVYVIGLISRSK